MPSIVSFVITVPSGTIHKASILLIIFFIADVTSFSEVISVWMRLNSSFFATRIASEIIFRFSSDHK